ncbi:hypothetical protein [Sorangium sp. So ce542]|uniref:hypothetical protein n=1 Tax=Sorangium sp. So ce542 TaxID=3133316 RepID=UPI003F5FE371
MKYPFDLQCWYLHPERTARFAGALRIDVHVFDKSAGETGDYLAKMQINDSLRRAILRRVAESPPPSIEQLLLTGPLTQGVACTVYKQFRCRGLNRAAMQRRHSSVLPTLYTPIRVAGSGDYMVEVPVDPARFTAASTYSHFHKRNAYLFVAGFVEPTDEATVTILPCVVASALDGSISDLPMEVVPVIAEEHVDTIDSFVRVRSEPRPRPAELRALDAIPEAAVKAAFGAILGEQQVSKDWSGERSDMYSAHVVLRGRRQSAAFVFKGPSKPGPMTLAHLGKNGDQLLRLSTEPAELLVLQHCDEVTPPVRELLRVIASQIARLRHHCVIDGYDTLRLLRAYGQCGLTPTMGSS